MSSGGGDLSETPSRRRPWITYVPVVAFVVIAGVFAWQVINRDSDLESALIGERAPEFELPALVGLLDDGGGEVPGFSDEDLIGQVTLVNVWGSWCVPCREEHPFLMDLAEDDRFRIFGLNQQDAVPSALAFLEERGNPYDAVGFDPRQRVSIDWGVYGVPETYVVDRDGVIRFRLVGPINEQRLAEELMPEIEKALAEPAA